MPEKLMVTGATGQLGRKVVAHLAGLVPAERIAVLVRSAEAQAEFAGRGIEARRGDYADRASLEAAFAGIDRLLLISGSEVGKRVAQHQNAIDAARAAGVGFVAYTSILNAAGSQMKLAAEHQATEAMLAESGLDHALLRNGWYTENFLMGLANDLATGQHFGAAGMGRFSAAPRKDYAEAAAAVLAGPGHAGKAYELGGDSAFTLAELAAEIAREAGKKVEYVNLPAADFTAALTGAGVPEPMAAVYADSDAQAAKGALFTESRDLSRLIGRPTTPLAEVIREML